MHEIYVGNIGTVYRGFDEKIAGETYREYVLQSDTNYGRAAGEDVAWFIRGELFQEHAGNRYVFDEDCDIA